MKTDAQLKDQILSELRWEPSVNAERINVHIFEGVVTLTGQVGSYVEKWNAEQAAQRVPGVRAMAVTLDVILLAPHQRTDPEIAASAASDMQRKPYVYNPTIKVIVERGWVTLSGEVEWEYQRQAAANALCFLSGIKGLNNNIRIKTKALPDTAQAQIDAALKRCAVADGATFKVDVQGATVTLSGTARSLAERESAKACAWRSEGVQNVVDTITVNV